MKATLISHGERAAGIRPSSFDINIDPAIEFEDDEHRNEIRIALATLGESINSFPFDQVLFDDECEFCHRVLIDNSCPKRCEEIMMEEC